MGVQVNPPSMSGSGAGRMVRLRLSPTLASDRSYTTRRNWPKQAGSSGASRGQGPPQRESCLRLRAAQPRAPAPGVCVTQRQSLPSTVSGGHGSSEASPAVGVGRRCPLPNSAVAWRTGEGRRCWWPRPGQCSAQQGTPFFWGPRPRDPRWGLRAADQQGGHGDSRQAEASGRQSSFHSHGNEK